MTDVMKYRPRTSVIEAFKFRRGMKHPALIYNEAVEGVGGPDYGDDYDVPVGHEGQTREVNDGEYVIIKADGLCEVMKATLFEAIYEAEWCNPRHQKEKTPDAIGRKRFAIDAQRAGLSPKDSKDD